MYPTFLKCSIYVPNIFKMFDVDLRFLLSCLAGKCIARPVVEDPQYRVPKAEHLLETSGYSGR